MTNQLTNDMQQVLKQPQAIAQEQVLKQPQAIAPEQVTIHEHADFASMKSALTALMLQEIAQALQSRGRADLALAGGATPFPIYQGIGATELAWEHIHIMPTDERWVASSHEANNLSKLRTVFPLAKLIPLVPYSLPNHPEAHTANHALAAHADAFDVVVLGMGNDAHFASLFPDSDALAAGLALDNPETTDALVLYPKLLPAEAPFPRITLSLARLLSTKRLLLWITGAKKREVLQAAMAGTDVRHMPIRALLQQTRCPLEIHWSPL